MPGGSPFERAAELFDRWKEADPHARQEGIALLREPLRVVSALGGYNPLLAELLLVTFSKIDQFVGHAPPRPRPEPPPWTPPPAPPSGYGSPYPWTPPPAPPSGYGSPYGSPPPPAYPPPPRSRQYEATGRPAAPPPPPQSPPPPRNGPHERWNDHSVNPEQFWQYVEDIFGAMHDRTSEANRARPKSTITGELAAAFSTLGVSPSSTWSQVKSAYRSKARQLHPDVNKEPKATEQFQRLGEAYATLERAERAGHFRGRP